MKWNRTYTAVQLISAQEAYGVPSVGGTLRGDCPFEESTPGCTTWILTIGKDSNPHVLLSGALHGDERVGPTVVMETASLLLEAMSCVLSDGTVDKNCLQQRAHLLEDTSTTASSSSVHQFQWLIRLVQTRYIIIIPSANALGYYRNERFEALVDPNRDFPYDVAPGELSLQSSAAQSIYHVFQHHMIQSAVTFHAGMEAIAYEWGAFSHYLEHTAEEAPDVVSQQQLSQLYQRVSSRRRHDDNVDDSLSSSYYPVGTMNDLVYPVNGGMEDWSYAASWDHNNQDDASCHNSSCRCFTVLVETSDNKQPPNEFLGGAQEEEHGEVGLVLRNIRLSLVAIEMVEPYVMIESVNGLILTSGKTGSCSTTTVSVPADTKSLDISWSVGGALTVEQTWLVYSTQSEHALPPLQQCGEEAALSQLELDLALSKWHSTTPQRGATKWNNHYDDTVSLFHAAIPVVDGDPTSMQIHALARVDASWAGGETHLSRVRTDPTWFHKSEKHTIQGRLDWISMSSLAIQWQGKANGPVREIIVPHARSSSKVLVLIFCVNAVAVLVGYRLWRGVNRNTSQHLAPATQDMAARQTPECVS